MDSFKEHVLKPLFALSIVAAMIVGFVLAATVVTLAWIQILG